MDQVHLLPSPLGCTPNLRETDIQSDHGAQ